MKKIISFFSIAILISFVPLLANAQTASLQSQLQNLLQQLSQLQNEANSTTTPGVTPSNQTITSNYTFTKSMMVGSRGADVSALQRVLINDGYLTVIATPSGYFGQATKEALIKYQEANDISPATGYCGVITMGFLNKTSSPTVSVTPTTIMPIQTSSANQQGQTITQTPPTSIVSPSPTSSPTIIAQATAPTYPFPTLDQCQSVIVSQPGTFQAYYQFSPTAGLQQSTQLVTDVQVPYYINNIYDSNSPTTYWLEYGTSTDALNATTTASVLSTRFTNEVHYVNAQRSLLNIVEGVPYYYRMVFQNTTSGTEVSPALNNAPCSFIAPAEAPQAPVVQNAPLIDPISNLYITTSSQYWFLGQEEDSFDQGSNGVVTMHYPVLGVFSTSTPDITLSGADIHPAGFAFDFDVQEFMLPCLERNIVGTYWQGNVGLIGPNSFTNTSTVPLSLTQVLVIPSSTTYTFHNDNGELEIISNPLLSTLPENPNPFYPDSVINQSTTFPLQCSIPYNLDGSFSVLIPKLEIE